MTLFVCHRVLGYHFLVPCRKNLLFSKKFFCNELIPFVGVSV